MKKIDKKIFLFCFFTLLLPSFLPPHLIDPSLSLSLMGTDVYAQEIKQNNAYIQHKRVLWFNDPAHEATLSWTTPQKSIQSDHNHQVYYDTIPRQGNLSQYQYKTSAQLSGAYDLKSPDTFHHATLTALQADTVYYFVIVSDEKSSLEYHFKTAPEDPQQSFQLIFGGDSRSDQSNRLKMNQLMRQLVSDNDDIYALVHGGDFVEDGRKWSDWKEWLQDHESIITSEKRILPLIPTRGNHEHDEDMFNRVFAFPGKGKNYFTTKIGQFACVTLNTEISMAGDQREWLASELKDLQAKAQWIVTNYHQPAWPAVKLPSGAKKHWVPLFEEFAVDLAFESDGHALKQTVPIKNNQMDEKNGVIYVGEGGLGVKQRIPLQKFAWYLRSPGYALASHHLQLLKVEPQVMTYTVYLQDGSQFSSIQLAPRRRLVKSPFILSRK